MVHVLGKHEEFPLTAGRYAVAISWDKGRLATDVDLQAVVIDNKGQVIDAVYYNNLKALRCITHSGDETTGERAGFDETIWIAVPKLPEQVHMILFVVATFTGHLKDVKNGRIHVLEDRKENEVACFHMKDSPQEVDVVAMMVRSRGWSLRVVDVAAQSGKHFMDILEPTIGNLVRSELPAAPRRLKVAFAMEKGAVVDLPQSSEIKEITAGLGWDTNNGNIDLDVSAVLFDAAGQAFDAVFFGNLESNGLAHSGDNLTGEGSGDDETIRVGLEEVEEKVQQIFFVVNIYTKGKTFEQVANPYCRILDPSGAELARYELQDGGSQTGLIIARLFRSGGGVRWGFQAIGSFCRGNTWKDSVVDVVPLFAKTAQQLQSKGAFTRVFTGMGLEESGASSQAEPPKSKSSACATM